MNEAGGASVEDNRQHVTDREVQIDKEALNVMNLMIWVSHQLHDIEEVQYLCQQ